MNVVQPAMLIDAVHPFDRIALKKLLKQTPKGSDYEVDPFTAAERDALLKAARPDEAPMMRFWFNSGLRPGELMALQWSRIDWIGRKTRIDENLVGRYHQRAEDGGQRSRRGAERRVTRMSRWCSASTASSFRRTTSGRGRQRCAPS